MSKDKYLSVQDLSVKYKTADCVVKALKGICFSLDRGQNLGIIGESGSGKTTIALALMGLIDKPHEVCGNVNIMGTDFLSLDKEKKRRLCWKTISMLFQNSLDVLNPVMKIGQQIIEPLKEMTSYSKAEEKLDKLLEMVGLERHLKEAYPHQLSGGMRQRALLAMALCCDPKILILDEPTSSLDAISSKQILKIIMKAQEKLHFSLVVISHDLSVMKALTEKMIVLYGGEVMEKGYTHSIIDRPMHSYTRGLINSSVDVFPYKDLWGIPGEIKDVSKIDGCVFSPRCTQSLDLCKKTKPVLAKVSINREVACHRGGIAKLLYAKGIKKSYTLGKREVKAVCGVDICIHHGETVALIGESGSGKSTLAHILAGLIAPDSGEVLFNGQKVIDNIFSTRENGIQLVLQDPFSSLSHRLTVEEAISEPLKINNIGNSQERKARVKKLLKDVQLPRDELFMKRHCSTLSGGQRQRVAIARSLSMKPKLLLADEITSMLDVSTQANIMRLLKGLQYKNGFAMLYITHDINLARKVAEKILVLYSGKVVEHGSVRYLSEQSCCHYTRELMEEGL